MANLAVAVTFFLIYFGIILGIGLIFYLFQAIAIYKMGKNMGFKSPWLAFVPFANTYAFGKVAETYVKSDGCPSARFSKILLTLQIILLVILIAVMAIAVTITLSYLIGKNIPLQEEIFLFVIFIILSYIALMGVAIAYSVVYYVALWRIFALYDYKNATLYLVLSIFLSLLYPIFLFVLKDKQPKFTFPQRASADWQYYQAPPQQQNRQ